MFEKKLEAQLKTIFGVKKVTFDQPVNSREQDCLFVEVETAVNHIKDGRAVSKVTANAVIFGQNDKVPFGFFSKAIDRAKAIDKKDFYFFDLESNTRRYQNLVQRGLSFVYFFDGQYDPELGSITSVTVNVSED